MPWPRQLLSIILLLMFLPVTLAALLRLVLLLPLPLLFAAAALPLGPAPLQCAVCLMADVRLPRQLHSS
jgi:hypothetical protein